MSNKIVIANWKMNPFSKKEAENILTQILKIKNNLKNTEIVICPPFPFLTIGEKLNRKNFSLGAQDVFEEKTGSFTGEVSSRMLSSLKVKYVILGHSERRALGETNKIVNKKILTSLKEKLLPIFCVGEKNRDSNGFYLAFIKHQIVECLASVPKNQIKNIIIAYEPIWAIGDKALHQASVDEFVEIQIFIKKVIADIYDIKTATKVKIIYGGSVHSSNALGFVQAGASGLLIGRNSLIPKKLSEIIKNIN